MFGFDFLVQQQNGGWLYSLFFEWPSLGWCFNVRMRLNGITTYIKDVISIRFIYGFDIYIIMKANAELEKKLFNITTGRLLKLQGAAKEANLSESKFLNFLIDGYAKSNEQQLKETRFSAMREFNKKLELEKAQREKIRAERKLAQLQAEAEKRERERQAIIRREERFVVHLAETEKKLNAEVHGIAK